jgi:cyclopropane fatty-acyl-phospholipid synthase-like methyltransferase
MEEWKKIWNSKNPTEINSLQDLINANGFESTGLTTKNLISFVTHISNTLGISQRASVYELGCGSGSNLYIFKNLGFRVGGCDYSQPLFNIANELDISDDITCTIAHEIDTIRKYDWVISLSVFQYFPDLEYAKSVADKMLEKSKKGIAILDLNDESKRELYYSIRRKSEPDYDKKYEGFEHLFIDKSFWMDFAKERALEIIIEDQVLQDYKNSEFRYNIYLKK